MRLSLKQKQLNSVVTNLDLIQIISAPKEGEKGSKNHLLQKALFGTLFSWYNDLNSNVIPGKATELIY